jgi:hypothetical protein
VTSTLDGGDAEFFYASRSESSAEAAPQLRSLKARVADLTLAAARALAVTGWRLESLSVCESRSLGAAGVAALVAAPTFALRHLAFVDCNLDAAALLALANAPWPLEELDLRRNDFSAAAAGPAFAALSRRDGLRRICLLDCLLSAASFKALVEAAWPALTCFVARVQLELDGPRALGADAFAGFPALEHLVLVGVQLGEAGARLLPRFR